MKLWRLRRRSFKLFMRPHLFSEPDKIPEGFDLEEWMEEFIWREERGISAVQPIEMTIEEGDGDCEDFAAVAASSMEKEGWDNISFSFYFGDFQLLPGHVSADGELDGEQFVFSNGNRWLMTPEEFADAAGYSMVWTRRV